MACIKEIAKDAKSEEIAKDANFIKIEDHFIKIEDQLLGLIRKQVETKLKLEEKFRELCEEVFNFVKEGEGMVQELERLSGNHVAKETVRLLRRGQSIIMANIIPPDHVDDLPVVKPNQPDAIPEPILVDEDEDPKEEEFEEEEEPQEEEDIDIDDEEDENEPELTFPYEEADPLNPPQPASDSKSKDVIEVGDTVELEDETIPVSVHEVGESSTASFHREDNDGLFPGLIRRDINSLFGNEMRSIVEEGAAAMENLVRNLGNAEERAECKKLKKELKDARIMPPKSTPLTQAAVRRIIRESVDAAIAAERARQANAKNNARAVKLRRWFEKMEMIFGISKCAEEKKVKFAAATLRGLTLTWWNSKVLILGLDVANQIGWTEMKKLMTTEFCPAEELQRMENELWNLKVKEYNMVAYNQRFNELALMCPRMVELKSAKIDAYIRGLSDNIKGEVTSSKPTNLNEAMRMAHKLREKKLQARNERILEGNKRKWENFQSGNNSGKRNYNDNSRQSSQNNQKQGNTRAMTTAPNKGKVSSRSLLMYECCFTCHVSQCTIKCHKCRKIRHKARSYKEPMPKEGQARGSSDRSFMDTRFSFMLDIDPVKIDTSYVVELADERVVSMNTILKGYTLNLVNHLFEIDLMPIELGTFDVKIGMDWLVKHDAVIIYGEKVILIPYENETLTVGSDKGMSQLKVISCIKARKYIERGCHLFLAYVTEKKPKEKQLEDVPVIHDFPEVFPDELPGLPLPRQVEFRIDQLRIKEEDIPITAFRTRYGHFEFQVMPFRLTNAPADKEKHGEHLKIILELLKRRACMPSFLSVIFWLDSIQFLDHVIDNKGVHVDPAKIEAIKNWAAPTTSTEVRQFLGLAGYYRRFIEGFSMISKPLTKLTQKDKKYEWGKEE
ncbi:reverse transcriptase domain-containing protein [Tanacetum coccineum]